MMKSDQGTGLFTSIEYPGDNLLQITQCVRGTVYILAGEKCLWDRLIRGAVYISERAWSMFSNTIVCTMCSSMLYVILIKAIISLFRVKIKAFIGWVGQSKYVQSRDQLLSTVCCLQNSEDYYIDIILQSFILPSCGLYAFLKCISLQRLNGHFGK